MNRKEFKQKILGLGFYNTYISYESDDNERTMEFNPKLGNDVNISIECSVYGMVMYVNNEIHLELSNSIYDNMYDKVYNEVKLMVRNSRIKKILK